MENFLSNINVDFGFGWICGFILGSSFTNWIRDKAE